MSFRWKHILCGGLLLAASAAHAVSQIGGGSIKNQEMGFSLDVPGKFQTGATVDANGNVALQAPMIFGGSFGGSFGGGFLQPQHVNVFLLPNALPDLANVDDPSAVDDFFAKRDWSKTTAPDPCIHAFVRQSDGARTIALTWGGGKGIVIFGQLTSDSLAAIDAMTASVKLDPGACAWK